MTRVCVSLLHFNSGIIYYFAVLNVFSFSSILFLVFVAVDYRNYENDQIFYIFQHWTSIEHRIHIHRETKNVYYYHEWNHSIVVISTVAYNANFHFGSFNIHIAIMDHAPCSIRWSPSHAANSISNRKSILRISELSKLFECLSISFPFRKGFSENCFYVRSESFNFTISHFALSVNSCSFRFSNNNLFIDFV